MKTKNTNMEIYNYLNLIDRRLGKLYKITGFSPFSVDFVVDEEKIKERLILNQMQNNIIFPAFIFNDKKNIKKYFKNSLKNSKRIIKNENLINKMDENFVEKFETYLEMRKMVLQGILKDFNNHDFDETAAFQELYNLNPIFGELLTDLYNEKPNFSLMLENLDKKYEISYLEKLQRLEKKTKKKKKQAETTKQILEQKNKQKTKNIEKVGKKQEKSLENLKKAAKKQEIKSVKEEIKQTKITNKNKEKT